VALRRYVLLVARCWSVKAEEHDLPNDTNQLPKSSNDSINAFGQLVLLVLQLWCLVE
jgi:hypothetical protein